MMTIVAMERIPIVRTWWIKWV